jgi:PhzF family phenazine biosynthesis protein
MMTVYQIDAFTNRLFGGNPAAVIPLQAWPSEALMQQIAMENNLSETVFIVPSQQEGVHYDIRWFTPVDEINLCGHATLATAYVLFEILAHPDNTIVFHSQSGLLTVHKDGDKYYMDFPSWAPEKLDLVPAYLQEALGGAEPLEVHQHRDLMVLLQDEAAVRDCVPDFSLMKEHFKYIIITAPGDSCDFVSRFFAPGSGVDEDPVTGSAHSQLIPFWSNRLQKPNLFARQLSQRGGELWCKQLNSDRVSIAGQCVFYMKGEINLG